MKLEINNQYPYSSYELSYFFFFWWGGGGGGDGRLFEVGRLKSTFWGWMLIRGWAFINFSTFRVSAYSRWALIRDWVLSRLNTVLTSTHQFNGKNLKKGIYNELSQLILLPKPIIVSRIVFPMLFYFKL